MVAVCRGPLRRSGRGPRPVGPKPGPSRLGGTRARQRSALTPRAMPMKFTSTHCRPSRSRTRRQGSSPGYLLEAVLEAIADHDAVRDRGHGHHVVTRPVAGVGDQPADHRRVGVHGSGVRSDVTLDVAAGPDRQRGRGQRARQRHPRRHRPRGHVRTRAASSDSPTAAIAPRAAPDAAPTRRHAGKAEPPRLDHVHRERGTRHRDAPGGGGGGVTARLGSVLLTTGGGGGKALEISELLGTTLTPWRRSPGGCSGVGRQPPDPVRAAARKRCGRRPSSRRRGRSGSSG